MSAQYHNSGILKGKTTVDNGGDLSRSVRETIHAQNRILRRFNSDHRFREAVRLAARADGVLNGAETAIEQVSRLQLMGDMTTRGAIEEQNAAARVTGNRGAIIG